MISDLALRVVDTAIGQLAGQFAQPLLLRLESGAPLSVLVQLDSSGRPTEVTVEVPRAHISSMGHVRTVPFTAVLAVQGDVLALSSAGTP